MNVAANSLDNWTWRVMLLQAVKLSARIGEQLDLYHYNADGVALFNSKYK